MVTGANSEAIGGQPRKTIQATTLLTAPALIPVTRARAGSKRNRNEGEELVEGMEAEEEEEEEWQETAARSPPRKK